MIFVAVTKILGIAEVLLYQILKTSTFHMENCLARLCLTSAFTGSHLSLNFASWTAKDQEMPHTDSACSYQTAQIHMLVRVFATDKRTF